MILTLNQKKNALKYSLLIFGSIDLFRGFMHTFLVKHASENIAEIVKSKYPTKEKNNIRVLMSGFGGSNYQTGILKILIASKSDDVLRKNTLLLGPIIAIINAINIRVQNINDLDAAIPGKYLMTVYNVSCLILFLLISL